MVIFFSSLPLSLIHKKPGIQALERCHLLPSSWSAGFPNKVIFLASIPSPLDLLASRVASRVSLDSVTFTLKKELSPQKTHMWSTSVHVVPITEMPLSSAFPVLGKQAIPIRKGLISIYSVMDAF